MKTFILNIVGVMFLFLLTGCENDYESIGTNRGTVRQYNDGRLVIEHHAYSGRLSFAETIIISTNIPNVNMFVKLMYSKYSRGGWHFLGYENWKGNGSGGKGILKGMAAFTDSVEYLVLCTSLDTSRTQYGLWVKRVDGLKADEYAVD